MTTRRNCKLGRKTILVSSYAFRSMGEYANGELRVLVTIAEILMNFENVVGFCNILHCV